MKRTILIDGNNLLFRSYYATAYNGNFMKNSKGFPTNALYGFVNMINKIINEENPEYIMVAFDKGKNFRHELYKDYKAGRIETPKELLQQFPCAKKILDNMGIKYVECDNYEADDIIGTFTKMTEEDKDYDATIISSDKDLLQLISNETNVKLLKTSGFINMNEKTFYEAYGIKPIRIIDLKALEGDPSDHIPGVKGVGEKTALSLLQKYDTLENVYEHIDEIKGALQTKLINDKENAFFSKKLATIYRTIDLGISLEDIKKQDVNQQELYKIYDELEFYSFIKKSVVKKEELENIKFKEITNPLELDINKIYAYYVEVDDNNYHKGDIIGMSLYDKEHAYYISSENIKNFKKFDGYSYDAKKYIVSLNKHGVTAYSSFDTLIASYLLELNIKDDISYLSSIYNYEIPFYETIVGKKKDKTDGQIKEIIVMKSKFIYEVKQDLENKLKKEKLYDLFNNIEMPLIEVLASMEEDGVIVDKNVLKEIKEEIEIKLKNLENDIFNYSGESFNINSPKQLGEILFEKLDLPHGKKKGRNGYKTDHDTLVKLINNHPIIEKILDYRELNKIFTTYLDNLSSYILSDGKIHTIYKQVVTRTGRLSSVEPNLQNIPVRSNEGKKIRKAFLPSEDSIFLSSDYSQIELRVLAHISGCKDMQNAIINHEDIHTKVASDIYDVPIEAVTKTMRRVAKSVIFGIVYGISGFGLGENIGLSVKEAQVFINKYLQTYPGVKEYMDKIVIEAKETGYVRTIMNRKRKIEELNNTNYIIRKMGERIALNTPIQGSSADIMKKAMIDIYKEFKVKNIKSKMILQVHDELIFDTLKNEKEMVSKIVENIMENTFTLDVPIKVEIDTGDNWYDAK